MNLQIYKSIVKAIRSNNKLTIDCLTDLETQFSSISSDTLRSILSLEYQRLMRVKYNKSEAQKNQYWNDYVNAIKNGEPEGIILRLSKLTRITPCLIAKLLLNKYLKDVNPIEDLNRISLNKFLKDTTLIPDARLAYEIFMCTIYDNLYSPLSDSIRQSTGQEYEIKLHNEALKLGLAFRDEEYLRKYGYDKTPDLKLDVPVAIDGVIVNWIESKALFGDEEGHREYMKSQYLSYWNRFGPGLVIYWFGYLETLVEQKDKRFIIRDHLPTNVLHIGSQS